VILRRLCEAAPQFDFPPVGYQEGPIKWIVDLDAEGKLLGFVPTVGDETKKNDRGRRMPFPFVNRTSGVAAQLLADKADYALGYVPSNADEGTAAKIVQRHQAFLTLLEELAQTDTSGAVTAVLKYLGGGASDVHADLAIGDMVTFRVAGELLIDQPSVRQFWAERENARQSDGVTGHCLVCGATAGIANPHPLPIKRVPGGQSSGCALVSVNADSFDSYGHKKSLTQSPVCWDCARDYAQVLNGLLADPKHHYRVQDRIVYVFWTRETSEFDLNTIFFTPEPQEVKALLGSVRTGKPVGPQDAGQFYALALSGSGGRVVIRDWLETTVDSVQSNLRRYFAAQDIADPDGQPGTPIGLYALLGAFIPSKGSNPWKELPPNLAAQFAHAVLNGSPLPRTLLQRAISRARAERGLTRPRAALIKLCLLLSSNREEGLELTAELNPELRDPAYLCGRLLSILESVQRAAVPGAKSTLIDKYYGTAATAPASVFGLLMRQAQAHLAKLRKDDKTKGAHYRLQQALEDVVVSLPEFPTILRLNEQGKFALGYYQQRAADRASRNDAITAKKQAADENDSQGGTDNV
jgi:CRISPR-associated protein Csd1